MHCVQKEGVLTYAVDLSDQSPAHFPPKMHPSVTMWGLGTLYLYAVHSCDFLPKNIRAAVCVHMVRIDKYNTRQQENIGT